MGKTSKSGLGIGVGSSPQGSIIQSDFDNKVIELNTIEPKPFDSSKFDYKDSELKYDGYLLKLDHPDGASKARFLKSVLGYKIGDSKLLHNAIGEAINGKLPNFVERTKFGLKYTFNAKIKGKDGTYKFANVVVVIQNDNGKTTWRIITLYPDKKD